MLNTQQIMEIIPHRYPMLLVDRILELEPGVRAVGIKCVSSADPYFVGHYPDHPIMPGVLIMEACAQVGGVALLSLEANRNKVPMFAGLDGCRWRKPVLPGDVLRMEVRITKQRGPIGKGEAKAYVGDDLVAEGEITFALGDK